MTVKTEAQHAGEFIASEANGARSRKSVTIKQGQVLNAGHVVGEELAGTITATAAPGNTGDGTLGTVTSATGVQAGRYVLTITAAAADAGEFQLVDPQGDVAGVGTVGTAFTGGGLSFTLADGAADFAVGDSFTITVESSGLVAEWNPSNTDGTDTVAGILYAGVDATSGNTRGLLIARKAEVSGGGLTYFDGATDTDKAVAAGGLQKRGVTVR